MTETLFRTGRAGRPGALPGVAGWRIGLFLALLSLAPGLAPSAGAQVQVCIEPADTTMALGDFVTVRVTTTGPPADLKGFLLRATHNAAVLGLVSTGPGSVLAPYVYSFFPHAAAPDTIGFDAAVLIGATQGPGTLGTFTFQATSPGICDLIPTQVLMRNSLNQPYAVTLCPGRVRVVTVTPTAPATWGGLKARRGGRPE